MGWLKSKEKGDSSDETDTEKLSVFFVSKNFKSLLKFEVITSCKFCLGLSTMMGVQYAVAVLKEFKGLP